MDNKNNNNANAS